MSHVVDLKIKIKNLPALAAAAQARGCELILDQKSHLYYAGKRAKCDHAIRVVGNKQAYEIGVVQQPDGTYTLRADFFSGGNGLAAAVGLNAELLNQEYAVWVAIQQLQLAGRQVQRQVQTDGSVLIVGR